MLSWLGRFLTSSIGKKTVMALTGLCLVGFLVAHLAGNLTFYTGGEEGLNAYAQKLEDLGPLLVVAEVALALLFVVHIALALRLSRENSAAREQGYRRRGSMGERTAGSSTMLITGLIVAVFLVIHLIDFRLPKLTGELDDLGAAVTQRLSSPAGIAIYLVGVTALGLHLSHAVQSALQTLGAAHPKYTPLLRGLGLLLAVVLFVGFASFPIYGLFLGAGVDR